MIYGGFGILAKDTLSWAILLFVWIFLFGTGILRKELSYMKKQGWEDYKKKSLILLPRLTESYIQNYLIYAGISLAAYVIYKQGGLFQFFGLF